MSRPYSSASPVVLNTCLSLLRSTASGVLSGLGRIAAILGNVTFGELVGTSCMVPMLLVAGLLGGGGLLALKLPNTTHRDLS